jgi:two-component system, NtrC family, response regulator AtoC
MGTKEPGFGLAAPVNACIPDVTGDHGFICGTSPAAQTLEGIIAEIAPTNIPVLLTGEIGTGKQMFAARIHRLSLRHDEPLVTVKCASMNMESLGSEMGLRSNCPGGPGDERMAGTVFFDEVSELEAGCQRMLLYALPDGDARPKAGMLAARVVSATSVNLDEEMRSGRFRSELYYRINGVCLRLPPLRERREDILPLTEFFLTKHAALFGRPRPSLSARTLRAFLDHAWPGNIRELENVVKNVVALGDEQIAVSEIAARPVEKRNAAAVPRGHSLKAAARAASREAERELILKALARTRWNRKRAAQELQISYKSLLYKLKQIGLQDSEAN